MLSRFAFVFRLNILSEMVLLLFIWHTCSLQDIIQKVKQSSNYASLLEHDQLLKLQRNKEALVGFSKSDYIVLKNLKHTPYTHHPVWSLELQNTAWSISMLEM